MEGGRVGGRERRREREGMEREGQTRERWWWVGPGRLCLKHHLLFYSFISQK